MITSSIALINKNVSTHIRNTMRIFSVHICILFVMKNDAVKMQNLSYNTTKSFITQTESSTLLILSVYLLSCPFILIYSNLLITCCIFMFIFLLSALSLVKYNASWILWSVAYTSFGTYNM